MQHYVAPAAGLDGFSCLHCGAYSHHSWHQLAYLPSEDDPRQMADFLVTMCARCGQVSLWHAGQIIYPAWAAPPPHPDLFESARGDYEEARAIVTASPRAAAALLRLALQKVCLQFGEAGRDMTADIDRLVERGLPAPVRQALALVRVVGATKVDPGKVDIHDTAEIAAALFQLTNLIIDKLIAEPKQINALLEDLA